MANDEPTHQDYCDACGHALLDPSVQPTCPECGARKRYRRSSVSDARYAAYVPALLVLGMTVVNIFWAAMDLDDATTMIVAVIPSLALLAMAVWSLVVFLTLRRTSYLLAALCLTFSCFGSCGHSMCLQQVVGAVTGPTSSDALLTSLWSLVAIVATGAVPTAVVAVAFRDALVATKSKKGAAPSDSRKP